MGLFYNAAEPTRRKRRLNQASFVLLCFVLFAISGLCLVFVVSVLYLSSVVYFPHIPT